ncbi:MAG: 4-hydroxythreonine-4-phosphate dehydrogenase PdxA, partial [Luteolibacter sp.]
STHKSTSGCLARQDPACAEWIARHLAAVRNIIITLGDPAGIGPEVIDAAMSSGQLPSGYQYHILGERNAGKPGKPDARSATAALNALENSVELLKTGKADAVVTGPVCKKQLQSVGFEHPGQTEFFASAYGIKRYAMMLTGAHLSVALVTIHDALAMVPSLITTERIVEVGNLTRDFLKQRAIAIPRIAVAGLNPHAGESGVFGNEEESIIEPAIVQLNARGDGKFFGPAVPDAVFRDAARGQYDAVLAMYHDQGLIPLKLLDFDNAVNVTMGLPKPRTSPDHGTAFNIAGKGIANPSSMIAAIQLACELSGHDI